MSWLRAPGWLKRELSERVGPLEAEESMAAATRHAAGSGWLRKEQLREIASGWRRAAERVHREPSRRVRTGEDLRAAADDLEIALELEKS
jgi:hypothetical protein